MSKLPVIHSLLNTHEAADFLGLKPSTIRFLAVSKKLKGVKQGSDGEWRFAEKELMKIQQSKSHRPLTNKVENNSQYSLKKKVSRTHAALLKDQQYLQLLDSENISVGFLILEGREHVITFINPVICKLWGRTKKQVIHKPLFKALPELKGQVFKGLLQGVYKTGIPYFGTEVPAEFNREGRKRTVYFNFVYSPMHDAKGTITGIFVTAIDVTSHVHSKKQLETEQDRIYNVLMQAPAMIAITRGPNLVFEFANSIYLQVVGKTKDIIGKGVLEVFPELKGQGILDLLFDVYKTGKPFIGTEVLVKLDRNNNGIMEDVYFNFVYQALKNTSGVIDGLMTHAVEVTEQVKSRQKIEVSEKALQQQLQLTAAITNTASACLFMIDHKGLVTFMNPAAQKITGFTQEEAVGKPIHSLIHHSYPDGSIYPESQCPLVATFMKGAPNPPYEDIFFRKDGSPFPVLITGTPIPGSQGIRETVVEFRDLSKEKHAQETLAENEERFSTLANSIQNLAWMANPDGWIFWYNKRWFDYTGTSMEEMRGWGWKAVHHPQHLDEVIKFVTNAWKKGVSWELTFPLRGADGTYRWFLTRAEPVCDAGGKVIRWIGTNTDIDDQKRALEQKDEFISVASHELKTPVTSVKAYAQILHARFQKAEDKSSAELVVKMDRQLDKLTNLIGDLLDGTKIEAGKFLFHKESFEFNELTREISEQVQRTTEKHTIVLKLAENRSISGDRERVGQVITNLLTNAIKYSTEKTKIIVSTAHDENSITLQVRDWGLGIPKQKQAKIFERFYRVEGAKHDTFPGLGLGLYISSEIIKRQGGEIWLESSEGKGSTFSFSLPLANTAKKVPMYK